MKYSVLAAGLLFAASTAQAAPDSFQASYNVSKGSITLGKMDVSLSYTANGYTYQKLTTANGLAAMISGDTLTERSSGVKQGENLKPKNYLHHHKNRRKEKRDEFTFAAPNQVKGKYDNNAYELQVPSNAIDPAMLEVRLMEDVANGKPLTYQVTNKGKLHTYTFAKLGKETLQVPAGRFECEKIQRKDPEGNRDTTVWLAPELNYGIVKIRHNEKGDVLEAQLTSFKSR